MEEMENMKRYYLHADTGMVWSCFYKVNWCLFTDRSVYQIFRMQEPLRLLKQCAITKCNAVAWAQGNRVSSIIFTFPNADRRFHYFCAWHEAQCSSLSDRHTTHNTTHLCYAFSTPPRPPRNIRERRNKAVIMICSSTVVTNQQLLHSALHVTQLTLHLHHLQSVSTTS